MSGALPPAVGSRGTESRTIAVATIGLCVIAFVVVAAIAIIAYHDKDVPDALASIGGGAVGALATMLTTFTPAPVVGGRRVTDPVPEPTPEPEPEPPEL